MPAPAEPRLSVCCLTGAPPEQLAAVLEPWRSVADEVVLGVDVRVDPAWQAAYRDLADRLVPVRFRYLEAHLAVLHAACRGVWTLRIDADELPSQALLDALPALMQTGPDHPTHWAVARRWLGPGADGWLDEQPWYPDWQVRLVRNDAGLRFSEELHSGPELEGPRGHTLASLLHLDCALQPVEERRRKALVYDVERPGLLAPGVKPMVAYYDPEAYATCPPSGLPEADAARCETVLGTRPAIGPDLPPAAESATEEVALRVDERDLRFQTGEHRPITCTVTNRTSETWPGGADADPPRFLAYRMISADGTATEGFRTPFPRTVAPGASVTVPVLVAAGEQPGRTRVEFDVVHEHVRWYGVGCAVELDVRPAAPAIDRREVRPSARRLRRPRLLVPRVLHRVWLGGGSLPEEYVRYGETWAAHHPSWEVKLWTDEDAPVPEAAERARNVAERADLVRYAILLEHGGVYVDTDVECLRPLDPLLQDVDAFAAYEVPGRLCNAVMGATPGHPALADAVRLSAVTAGRGHYPEATATLFLTRVLEPRGDVTLFAPARFYPHLWDEVGRPNASHGPDTYAVHHWAKSWSGPDDGV